MASAQDVDLSFVASLPFCLSSFRSSVIDHAQIPPLMIMMNVIETQKDQPRFIIRPAPNG